MSRQATRAGAGSLLERIAAGRRATTLEVSPALVAESVLRHLERLFNVRHGSVAACPDYGLPDLSSLGHDFSNVGGAFKKAIEQAIEKFEPRLRNTSVTSEIGAGDLFKLRFQISSRLVFGGVTHAVSFTTRMDDDGKYRVEI